MPEEKQKKMDFGFEKQQWLFLQKEQLKNQHSLKTEIMEKKDWPLWEIFIRSKQGLNHKHVGSLRAADAEMAVENARDVYTRRSEGISIWVIESNNIHASDSSDADMLFEPSNTKVYRHPTFYDVPDGISHM